MRRLIVFFSIFCLFHTASAQNGNEGDIEMVRHTVELGETVRMISKKYLVNPTEIYRYNKFAVDGIREGMVLMLPVPKKEPAIAEEPVADSQPESQGQAHEAPSAEESPKKMPAVQTGQVAVIDRSAQTAHTVQSGETLYSLSRQYGVSVDEIKLSNPQIKKGLQVGQVVHIPTVSMIDGNASSIGSDETPKMEAGSHTSENGGQPQTISHEVLPKETLYSLSKRYNVTVEEIKAQNPSVEQHGLQIGQTLTIRTNN